jgi:hypothetical protein
VRTPPRHPSIGQITEWLAVDVPRPGEGSQMRHTRALRGATGARERSSRTLPGPAVQGGREMVTIAPRIERRAIGCGVGGSAVGRLTVIRTDGRVLVAAVDAFHRAAAGERRDGEARRAERGERGSAESAARRRRQRSLPEGRRERSATEGARRLAHPDMTGARGASQETGVGHDSSVYETLGTTTRDPLRPSKSSSQCGSPSSPLGSGGKLLVPPC